MPWLLVVLSPRHRPAGRLAGGLTSAEGPRLAFPPSHSRAEVHTAPQCPNSSPPLGRREGGAHGRCSEVCEERVAEGPWERKTEEEGSASPAEPGPPRRLRETIGCGPPQDSHASGSFPTAGSWKRGPQVQSDTQAPCRGPDAWRQIASGRASFPVAMGTAATRKPERRSEGPSVTCGIRCLFLSCLITSMVVAELKCSLKSLCE